MTKSSIRSPSIRAVVHLDRLGCANRRWTKYQSVPCRTLFSDHRKTVPRSSNGSPRSLAQVRSEPFSELWFTAAFPTQQARDSRNDEVAVATSSTFDKGSSNDHKPPDGRTVRLGKTLRALSPHLPNILTTPLPPDLLSAQATLHLFPSTHPHLPVVRGRVPYQAALWTAPVAWGSVPIVGNVKLVIQSEKMVRTGMVSAPTSLLDSNNEAMGEEKLVVRWMTGEKAGSSSTTSAVASPTSFSSSTNSGGINRGLSKLLGGDKPLFNSTSTEPFTGLFVFSFDQDGKIASMTIEHADESHGCDKTSRMVTLTDWLLGRAKWGRAKEEEVLIPGLAMTTDPYLRRLHHHRKQR